MFGFPEHPANPRLTFPLFPESPGRHLREIKLQSARDASVKSAKNARVIPEPQRVTEPDDTDTSAAVTSLVQASHRL